MAEPDEVDRARASHYALLGSLMLRAPTEPALALLAETRAAPTPLGLANIALAEAAAQTDPDRVRREFFNLFIGVGRGELVPYASFYLTGFLNDQPLARLRSDLARLGLCRAEKHFDPEDHIGSLCEVMCGLVDGSFGLPASEAETFHARHLAPWAERFFAELEMAAAGRFYGAVGRLGRTFLEIERDAYAIAA